MIRHSKLWSLWVFLAASFAYSSNVSAARTVDVIACNRTAPAGATYLTYYGRILIYCANASGRCDFSSGEAEALCSAYGGVYWKGRMCPEGCDAETETYASGAQKAYCDQLLASRSPAFMSNGACVALSGGLKQLDPAFSSALTKPILSQIPAISPISRPTPKSLSILPLNPR